MTVEIVNVVYLEWIFKMQLSRFMAYHCPQEISYIWPELWERINNYAFIF